MEYDVIVVGAGPAGSSAAKAAAERGAKTILLEEHPVIGLPRHCTGTLAGTTQSRLTEELLETMDKGVVVGQVIARRLFAPSGKMIHEIPLKNSGSMLIRRDLFDQELARQAANAGADIRVNTRVTGLLKRDGKTIGVTTGSGSAPEVHGKIVIAADGIRADINGITSWEGLGKGDERRIMAGLTQELTRVRDIEAGVIEVHFGAFSSYGFLPIYPRSGSSCITGFPSLEEYERAREGDYLISRKLKDAVMVTMTGHSRHFVTGLIPKAVKDGLIVCGAAAGLRGILAPVLSGRYAAQVATVAIQEGNLAEGELRGYEQLVKRLDYGHGVSLNKVRGLSDEAIEELLPVMLERGELGFWDRAPL